MNAMISRVPAACCSSPASTAGVRRPDAPSHRRQTSHSATKQRAVSVAAASDLKFALDEILGRFSKRHIRTSRSRRPTARRATSSPSCRREPRSISTSRPISTTREIDRGRTGRPGVRVSLRRRPYRRLGAQGFAARRGGARHPGAVTTPRCGRSPSPTRDTPLTVGRRKRP